MLFISLSTALLSFLAFGSVSFYNMKNIYDKTIFIGTSMGESIAKFTEKFAVKQAKERLSALALEKSKRIELGMSDVKNDAEAIAYQTKNIFSHPEKFLPKTLPKPTDKEIYSGEAYIHFAPELQNKELTSELKKEIDLTSNIADVLRIKANFYKGHQTSLFIGSKNGYLICIDTLPNEHGTVTFTKEFNETYDPRERPWYKAVEKAGKTVVTDYYLSADGLLSIDCATPYYDANGEFAGVAAVGASLESLYQQVTEDKLGNTNINFTLSDNGEVVLSSISTGTFAVSEEHKDLRKSTEPGLSKEIINMTTGKSDVALVNVEGKEYYLAYSPMPSIGWSYGTLIERNEVIQPANVAKSIILNRSKEFATSLQSFYMQHIKYVISAFVIIILLLFVISIKTTKSFVSPIVKLTNGVKEIAKGDLDKKLDIKTGDEIEVLADGVNNMTSDLKEYMKDFSNAAAEKERIATELNVAKNIQAGMLPSVDPDFSNNKEFDLAATMIPAKEVGGDFYDFYMLDESHLAVTVADVSGKGVGAALFMVISKTLLKDLTMIDAAFFDGKEPDVASIVERANKFLYDNNEEKMFVTVFYGVLNLKTGEFVYVNAGHNPPMVRYQKDREFSFIRNEKRNPIIGVKRKIKYQEYRLTLSPGDMIFFYTDGITEAMNSQRELYNEKRLKSALDNMSDECKANDIISTVYKDVKLHVGDAEQSDDMTLLGLVYKRGESVGEEGIL